MATQNASRYNGDGYVSTEEYNKGDWRRNRLTAVYQLAHLHSYECDDAKAHKALFDLVVSLLDHEGNLTVYWNVPVHLIPQSYKDCFVKAWGQLNEPKECVEHEYEEQSIF